MTRIHFAKTLAGLLRGADALLILGPAAAFARPRFADDLPEALRNLVAELARDAKPGDLGSHATSLTGTSPRTLAIGVLPDGVSRHNSPSRAESIRKVTAAARVETARRTAILLVLDDAAHALPAVNAIGRALPSYTRKRSAPTGEFVVLAVSREGKPLPIDERAREIATTARRVAELVDTPPTELHPEALAREARALLRGLERVSIREIRGDALLRAGLRGIHAVGRTAVVPPRVLVASYKPARPLKGHVALVGKGVTYDTGGLHIKARGAMETMKADMGGAAAVLGAFRVLVATGSRRRLTVVLCLAENAIGPAAYKPDDILELHSGLTVEINNTDAEGRLLLADGVSYAVRELKADTVLDAATLTGAQLVATGNLHAAVVSSDAALESIAIEAGRRSGDLVHPLPFAPEFYKSEFRSSLADMCNSVKDRSNAQPSCAAQFVHWHIEDTGARWCHIDCAGPAFRSQRATGFGVALLADMVESLPT